MRNQMCCRHAITVFFGLFAVLPSNLDAQSPKDSELHSIFWKQIAQEVDNQKFDLLESQYSELKNEKAVIEDGTPKIWLYFESYYENNRNLTANIQEAQEFTKRLRAWHTLWPDSIAAILALCNALVGESDRIWDVARKENRDPKDAESRGEVKSRLLEFNSTLEELPRQVGDQLRAEAAFYAVKIKMLAAISAPFDAVQEIQREIEQVDTYYVPFYLTYSSWLLGNRQNDRSLPRPEVWLTNRFKTDILDTEEIKRRKCRAYAQIIAFHGNGTSEFKADLLDWSTLESGLRDLVHSYGSQTDWPSRYLVTAFAFHDKDATREALAIVNGNYSTDIIKVPTAFQAISKWAETQ